jgi:hypothetical protein
MLSDENPSRVTATSITSFFQVSPQSTGMPLSHSSRVLPNGCPIIIRGMSCSRLLALSCLTRASFVELGWCISTSCKDTVRCLDFCLILAMWFRMVLVAWGPFRWWASCRQAKRKKEEEVQVKQDAEEAARQETICLEEEAEVERKQAEEEEVL